MPVLHYRAATVHGSPPALPRLISEIEILHISRIVDLGNPAQSQQLFCIEQRASAATVKNPRQTFIRQRLIAPHWKIHLIGAPPHCFTGFLSARAGRKNDLRRRAEKVRHTIECSAEGRY